MEKINNFVGLRVFFIGIGGISMSGLAKLILSMGAKVSGSDVGKTNPEIAKLRTMGVNVYENHDAGNISNDIDLVVYNFAIKEDNPEYLRAKMLGLEILSRAEFLGVIASSYRHVISVAGTHGKTTTTAMIGEIFTKAELNPTIHIGGVSNNLMTNTVIGGRDYFIVEACEYHGGFDYLNSDYGVILNIDADHLDYYGNLDAIHRAFGNFAKKSKTVVLGEHVEIEHPSVLRIGREIYAKNIRYSNYGFDYDVYIKDKFWSAVRLNAIGKHNVSNSLYAIMVSILCGVPKDKIVSGISGFNGVERRNEVIGRSNGVPIVIDYAHHPTEIVASINGIKNVASAPLIIFQPHTYSRTLALFDDFVKVFKGEENLIAFQTYPAREKEIIGGRAEDLSGALPKAKYVESLEILLNDINECTMVNNCDMVLVLGAGDLAEKLKIIYKGKL